MGGQKTEYCGLGRMRPLLVSIGISRIQLGEPYWQICNILGKLNVTSHCCNSAFSSIINQNSAEAILFFAWLKRCNFRENKFARLDREMENDSSNDLAGRRQSGALEKYWAEIKL